jgi:hypothetical protein
MQYFIPLKYKKYIFYFQNSVYIPDINFLHLFIFLVEFLKTYIWHITLDMCI